MECLKNCCKTFMSPRVKEHEQQVITVKIPPNEGMAPGWESEEGKGWVTEDYLLSKLPPDGREVPFVLPTFKASYIQPRGSQYPNLQSGLQSSARCTYAQRKAELLASGHFNYNLESGSHHGQMTEYVSPGSTRRDTLKNRNSSPQSPGWSLKADGQQHLSSSMFDLSSPQSHMQRFDSVSSILSSTSSKMDSLESSLDSITLSGDERELGKVCVRLSYQEAMEQVWITVVQCSIKFGSDARERRACLTDVTTEWTVSGECSDLSLPPDVAEPQKIGIKGIITVPKPIQFRSSVKEFSQDVSFMETFVFTLRLQQLRCSALVLRLQTHNPRKRTVAEGVLSLRQLGHQEAEHWLDFNPPSKSSVCHSELHLTTCFQPVNGRIQLQVLAAHNLPASSTLLGQSFFVRAELHQSGQVVMKKKTRVKKASGGQCQWAETFHFLLAALDQVCSLSVKLYKRSSVRRKQCLGQVQLGLDSPGPEAVEQWKDTMAHPEKVVSAWHRLSPS